MTQKWLFNVEFRERGASRKNTTWGLGAGKIQWEMCLQSKHQGQRWDPVRPRISADMPPLILTKDHLASVCSYEGLCSISSQKWWDAPKWAVPSLWLGSWVYIAKHKDLSITLCFLIGNGIQTEALTSRCLDLPAMNYTLELWSEINPSSLELLLPGYFIVATGKETKTNP